MYKVETYIEKLKGEDLQTAFSYSLLQMTTPQDKRDLKDTLECMPVGTLAMLARMAETAARKVKVRDRFTDKMYQGGSSVRGPYTIVWGFAGESRTETYTDDALTVALANDGSIIDGDGMEYTAREFQDELIAMREDEGESK